MSSWKAYSWRRSVTSSRVAVMASPEFRGRSGRAGGAWGSWSNSELNYRNSAPAVNRDRSGRCRGGARAPVRRSQPAIRLAIRSVRPFGPRGRGRVGGRAAPGPRGCPAALPPCSACNDPGPEAAARRKSGESPLQAPDPCTPCTSDVRSVRSLRAMHGSLGLVGVDPALGLIPGRDPAKFLPLRRRQALATRHPANRSCLERLVRVAAPNPARRQDRTATGTATVSPAEKLARLPS